jgi:hypothetical protein
MTWLFHGKPSDSDKIDEAVQELGKRTFEYQRIRDLVANLTVIEDRVLSLTAPDGAVIPVISIKSKMRPDGTVAPRDRFILSCKWYIAVLTSLVANGPKRPPIPTRL